MNTFDPVGRWVWRHQVMEFRPDGSVIMTLPDIRPDYRADGTWRWTECETIVLRREREDAPLHEVEFHIADADTLEIRKELCVVPFVRRGREGE